MTHSALEVRSVYPGLVSTVIPVFNRPQLLLEAVVSVLQQSYRPIQILIVDDGSTDSTSSVANRLQSEYPDIIRVIHQENAGVGSARQLGLEHATGEFIQFLDSDDFLLPQKFALSVAALQRKPEADIAYGISYEENHRNGPPRCEGPMRDTGIARNCLFPRLLNQRWWTTSCPLYRFSLLERIGPIRPWINEEDWEFDARCGATGAILVHVDAIVSLRRLFNDGDHLSADGSTDPRKLAHRALAQQSIFCCARIAGVGLDAPEMKLFSRSSFLLSRRCADAGLEGEAADLFKLSRSACIDGELPLDLLLYGWFGGLFSWRRSARLFQVLRGLLHLRRLGHQ